MERNDLALLVRIPKTLKQDVVWAADQEDVSTNAWIKAVLKRAVQERQRTAERRARQAEQAA